MIVQFLNYFYVGHNSPFEFIKSYYLFIYFI